MKNSLTDEDMDYIAKKRLVALVGQLNDAEIIWLRSYGFRVRHIQVDGYKEFYATHKAILAPLPPGRVGVKSDDEVVRKKAFRDGYIGNLERLGLIEDRFEKVNERDGPKFDERTGRLKSKGTALTGLGRLLLSFIDMPVE